MKDKESSAGEKESTPLPAGQGWFDHIFLWLILSIVISGLLYNVWGMIELFVFTK